MSRREGCCVMVIYCNDEHVNAAGKFELLRNVKFVAIICFNSALGNFNLLDLVGLVRKLSNASNKFVGLVRKLRHVTSVMLLEPSI